MYNSLIQQKVNQIIQSINSYNIDLNEFNKYYNAYDNIIINKNDDYILNHKYFNTNRYFDNDDLYNLKISYENVKYHKGYYSHYTNKQSLNILHKLTILDEEISNEDLFINIKRIIINHPSSIFFFGIYEQTPIIRTEKDIYNSDLSSLFINIDDDYEYYDQIKDKEMLNDNDI